MQVLPTISKHRYGADSIWFSSWIINEFEIWIELWLNLTMNWSKKLSKMADHESIKTYIYVYLCKHGVGWRRLRCARRHARGHKLQRCQLELDFCLNIYSVTKDSCYKSCDFPLAHGGRSVFLINSPLTPHLQKLIRGPPSGDGRWVMTCNNTKIT